MKKKNTTATNEEPVQMDYATKIVRNKKTERRKRKTSISINQSLIGDSIENMIERLRQGEGEEGIPDRDLVYNDNESRTVNPITNIRSDKMELMLEEKIGEYEHKNRTLKVVKDDPEEEKTGTGDGETQTEE